MEKIHGGVFLTDRQEIARAMNFRKHPVLWMEVGKSEPGGEGQIYGGCKATVMCYNSSYKGEMPYTGDLQMYSDEQNDDVDYLPQYWDHIHLKSWGACLKADFGYHDVMDNLEKAQAPVIEPNQEVIVVFKDSVNERCWVRKMVTSGRVDPHCATMLTIENPKEAD